MARTKRAPSNTVSSLVNAMQAALAGDIEPPPHVVLDAADLPFWHSVMRARARAEWTEADLCHAANLARCLADIERESAELRAEGSVIRNDKGTPIANPRHAVLERLSGRAMSLTRILQMQSATTGDRDKKIAARSAEASARTAAKTLEEELIPS